MKATAKEGNKPRLDSPSRQSFIRSLKTSAFIKLALFSANACFLPKWVSILAFLLSQLQIFSIFANTAVLSLPENDGWLQETLQTIHQICSVGDLWNINEAPNLTLALLIMIFIIIIVEIYCVIHLVIGIFIHKLFIVWVENLWCIMTNIHLYIFFYPIHFIGTKTLFTIWEDNGGVLSSLISSIGIQVIIFFCLSWNIIYSITIIWFLSPKIKTKNLLCSHTRLMDFADLMIKLTAPTLWFFGSKSTSLYIALLAINLVYSVFRDGVLFWFLPYYSIRLLKAATSSNAIITLFAFCALLPKIVRHNVVLDNPTFSALVFVLMSPLFISFYSGHLQKTLINILANPEKINCYHLLHYWDICKYFSSQCRPQRPRSRVIDEHYLFFGSVISKSLLIKELFAKEIHANFWDPKTTDTIEKHLFHTSLDLLKAYSQRGSDREIIKCCLARYYSKYEGLYVLADDLVHEGAKKSSSVCLTISFYLIRIDLFKKVNGMGRLMQDHQDEQGGKISQSDIQKYFQMYDIYEYLKKCMAEQLKLQIKFWSNFQLQEPDCYLLLDLAKKVHVRSVDVKKGWVHYRSIHDSQFTQPFLIYGLYHSFVQNDYVLGDHFLQHYYTAEAKKSQEEKTVKNKIGMKLLYDSVQLSVSGYANTLGKIIDCSNNVEKLLGYKKTLVLEKSINSLVPSLFPDKHENGVNHSNKLMILENINNSKGVQALDKEGYLVSCRIYVTLKFFYDGILCYYVLLHPRKDKKRIVTIRNNGKIVNCSKEFQEDLGFSTKERVNLSIFSLCPKLRDVVYERAEAYKKLTTENPNTIQKVNTEASPNNRGSLVVEEPAGRKSIMQVERTRKVCLDFLGEAYQKYNKEEKFFFCYPPQRNRSSVVKLNYKVVSYNVKVESSFSEGDMLFVITLNKISADKKSLDPTGLTTINIIREEKPLEIIRQESTPIQDDSFAYPLISSPKDPMLQSPSSSGLGMTIFKKAKIQLGVGGLSEAGDEEGEGFSSHVNGRTKAISGTVLSEENEDYKLLKCGITEFNEINPPVKSKSPERLLSKLVTITPDEPFIQKKGTIESTENSKQPRSKQQLVVKPNEGDSDSLNLGASFNEYNEIENAKAPVKLKTIKLQPKKEEVELSEDNMAKKFLQKDSHKLRQKAKNQKEIQQILGKKEYKKSAILYNGLFGLAMLVELIFVIWLNYNVLGASQDAANSSEVLQATFFRNYWLNLANLEERLYVGVRNKWVSWPMRFQTPVNNLTYRSLNNQNQVLKRSISNLKPELQALFFEKNIKMYQRDKQGQKIISSIDDSFQALDKIIHRGFANVYKPSFPTYVEFTIDIESQFVFDNSFDDFYVGSDRLIQTVETHLFDNLTNASQKMTIFLSFCIVLIVFFVVYSFKFVIDLNNEYRRFLRIFLTIQPREAKKTELVLSNFYNLVKEDSGAEGDPLVSVSFNLYNIKNAKAKSTSSEANFKVSRRSFSRSSLKRTSHRNWILLIQLSVAVFGALGFMLVYYTRALNEITTIENHQRNINSALDNMNKEMLVGAQIQALAMDNGTSTIRYQPIYDALQANLDSLQAVNDLLKNLRDQEGQLSERQQQIFFGLNCSEAITPYYVLSASGTIKACNTVSKGSGRLGLANIIPELTTGLRQYLLSFQSSDKTISSLKQVYIAIPNTLLTLVDICTVFFLLSLNATIVEYQTLMNDLEDQRTTLAWIAVVISLILSILLWLFIIRKLIHKIFDSKEMLKLIPVKFILKNLALKKYVQDLDK